METKNIKTKVDLGFYEVMLALQAIQRECFCNSDTLRLDIEMYRHEHLDTNEPYAYLQVYAYNPDKVSTEENGVKFNFISREFSNDEDENYQAHLKDIREWLGLNKE